MPRQMEEDKLAYWLENEFDKGKLGQEPALEKVMVLIGKASVPMVDADKVWKNIEQKKAKPAGSLRLVKWVSAIAAIFVGLLFVSQLFSGQVDIKNSNLAPLTHILPDGSEVILNTNSAISYEKDFLSERTISLKGEAFYKVAKGSTFTVDTDKGNVKVLGTSFNVFSRERILTVVCKTGKVSVTTAKGSTTLEPGDRVSLQANQLIKDTTLTDHIGAWTKGSSTFNNATMEEVVSALKSKYNLTIKGNERSLKGKHFTGTFVNDDVDKAIEMVFLPMDIKYILKNNDLLILDQ